MDKYDATFKVAPLCEKWRKSGSEVAESMALGDLPADLEMLEAAYVLYPETEDLKQALEDQAREDLARACRILGHQHPRVLAKEVDRLGTVISDVALLLIQAGKG